jgi:hypothetical protein
MIVLDTNAVSEPIRPQGNAAVTAWLDGQVADTLYLTATSLSELLVGIEILPLGRRRTIVVDTLNKVVDRLFGSRILAFDRTAALAYATLVGRARSGGCTISMADGQIAAIAEVHGFAVATRDTVPFAAAGVPVINPWLTE